jgi:hypothetical protein
MELEFIMIEREQAARFLRLERAAPELYSAFQALTRAHAFFQGPGALRSISVSDVLDNGSIEATFQGVRIKFAPLLMLGTDRSPRVRVVCMQCHCTYGDAVQETLGSFTYGEDGVTDLEPDVEGNFPRIDAQGATIVLRFLEAAIHANRSI